MKYFYEKNNHLIDHKVNKTFDEILWMSDQEFRDWFIELRKTVAQIWDDYGNPPRVGKDEEDIKKQFKKMAGYPVHEFETIDELTGESDIIRNHSGLGNAVNQWFPTMMKTRINYSEKDVGLSIYDHFAKDELLEKTIKYARRHFKRDSFYQHSRTMMVGEEIVVGSVRHTLTDVKSFVEWFESKARQYGTHDYWIEHKKGIDYSGYNEKINKVEFLLLTKEQLLEYNIPESCKTNIDYEDKEGFIYTIRFYEKGQKLFPAGYRAFRVSWCQYAVNFPPMTAKYLYEKYTKHIENQDTIKIYDPSAGWGGRLLGAMSVRSPHKIHYIGTDPNKDHTITLPDGSLSTKYHDVARFYNETKNEAVLFKKSHTHEIYQLGSEVIGENPDFQKHKGELDMVFTSPPYFSKEAYSEDDEQSYKKFDTYEVWRDGFLKQTLKTAVEYLRNDRYLLWNIADIKLGKNMLPLENDSREILEGLGMTYKGVLKMALARMPGANRIDSETGEATMKNSCKINGNITKYEPVFVYYKP